MRRYDVMVNDAGFGWTVAIAGCETRSGAQRWVDSYRNNGKEARVRSRRRRPVEPQPDSPSLQDTAPLEYFTER